MTVKEIIKEREATHGDFGMTGAFAQELKRVIRKSGTAPDMRDETLESLDLICTKIARIISHENGENVSDNWADIAGYAELAKKAIEKLL